MPWDLCCALGWGRGRCARDSAGKIPRGLLARGQIQEGFPVSAQSRAWRPGADAEVTRRSSSSGPHFCWLLISSPLIVCLLFPALISAAPSISLSYPLPGFLCLLPAVSSPLHSPLSLPGLHLLQVGNLCPSLRLIPPPRSRPRHQSPPTSSHLHRTFLRKD